MSQPTLAPYDLAPIISRLAKENRVFMVNHSHSMLAGGLVEMS